MFRNILDNYVVFYLNDTLIYFSETFEDHKQKIEKIFRRFDKQKFYLKFEKYIFH